MQLTRHLSIMLFFVVTCNAAAGETLPKVPVEEIPRISLGKIMPRQEVNRIVNFENSTDQQLNVRNIQLTPPLLAKGLTPVIAPGKTGQFALVLDRKRPFGEFRGVVRINFRNDNIAPIEFNVDGFIVPPIEYVPYPAFYVATDHGELKKSSIEIINHQKTPLKILGVEHQSKRFSLDLKTITPGQHYRLTLTLRGDKPGEKQRELIRLITDTQSRKVLTIQANTWVRNRVYTYPESIDMGRLPLHVTQERSNVTLLSQTLMVYRKGAADFEISVSTDLDSVNIESERGPNGDRFQLTVSLIPEKIRVGKIDGSIYIKTNDPEFTNISIPIQGSVFNR